LQDDSVGVATALSPATVGHFKFLFHQLFVGLGLVQRGSKRFRIINYWEAGCRCRSWHEINQSLELYRAAIYCEKHQPIASNGAGLN
jgi:hypothetical protein